MSTSAKKRERMSALVVIQWPPLARSSHPEHRSANFSCRASMGPCDRGRLLLLYRFGRCGRFLMMVHSVGATSLVKRLLARLLKQTVLVPLWSKRSSRSHRHLQLQSIADGYLWNQI